MDFSLFAHLADYHCCRLLATTHLAFFRQTEGSRHLHEAHRLLIKARRQWQDLVSLADGVYASDLVFGHREKGHCGHWKDDEEVVENDLVTVNELMAASPKPTMDSVLGFIGGRSLPDAPAVEFVPPTQAQPGNDFMLRMRVNPASSVQSALCHYRNANQAEDFYTLDMQWGDGDLSVSIPGKNIEASWDLMLFFEFYFANGSATRWPDWRTQTPYFVVTTGCQDNI